MTEATGLEQDFKWKGIKQSFKSTQAAVFPFFEGTEQLINNKRTIFWEVSYW